MVGDPGYGESIVQAYRWFLAGLAGAFIDVIRGVPATPMNFIIGATLVVVAILVGALLDYWLRREFS